MSEADSKPQDKCAIVGVYSRRTVPVAKICREMLIELNHRGQESSGIAVADGQKIKVNKARGLAEKVFSDEKNLPQLTNPILAVGHNRYSTSGSLEEIQPFLHRKIILAHNGNLTNIRNLEKLFLMKRKVDEPRSDSWLALKLIASQRGDLFTKVYQAVGKIEGAFSFVIATADTLMAIRDPWGFRPLVLGKLEDGWAIASESVAIEAVGGKILRSILPGEILTINKNKLQSTIYSQKIHHRCIFELIYLERPDSVFDETVVEQFRIRCGKILGRKAPVKVDAVIPVPRSGISAAIGLSEELRLPYREGLYTNPYRGNLFGHRTFIRPNGRERTAAEKFSILEHVIREYPRIILTDDSIVRGTTMKELILKLRRAGAYEIHLRVASPPLISPCGMGVDFGAKELLAAKFPSLEARRKFLDVDSLVHLTPSELIEAAIGNPINGDGEDVFSQYGFCGACFNGQYPFSIEGVVVKKRANDGKK